MYKMMSVFITILITATYGFSDDSTPKVQEVAVKELFVDVDGAKLFCRVYGSGKPLVVLHGGPGLSQDYLLPYMAALAQERCVIFYDQRGCGQSTGDVTDQTITLQKYLEDLETIRKFFAARKISVLGHSWGGHLAMEYAIAYPEKVDKLILSNSMPSTSDGLMLFVNEWMRRMAPYEKELAALHELPGYKDSDPDVVEQMHRLIFSTYVYNPAKALLLNIRMSQSAAARGNQVYELLHKNVFEKAYNNNPALNRLAIPTLVIHGEDDPIPASTAKETHENIPGSQYVLMKECGHFPYVEDPEFYFQAVSTFLGDR